MSAPSHEWEEVTPILARCRHCGATAHAVLEVVPHGHGVEHPRAHTERMGPRVCVKRPEAVK